MGLLAVDVTAHGVVMSADSQPVEILDGENRVDTTPGRRTRNPIIRRVGGGFVGLVGFVGTEQVDGHDTARWLSRFARDSPTDDVSTFCNRLADALSEVWKRERLRSVLEILVAGEVSSDLQFWFVRNSQGLRSDGTFNAPADEFVTQDELANYVLNDGQSGETKDDVLQRVTYSIRQGILLPASPVFDGFSNLMRAIWAGNVEGFTPLASLDDVGYFVRVRMEFLKRLCSTTHGIHNEGTPSPIGGDVHVYGVGRDGRTCRYPKKRNQVETIRHGRR